MNEQILRELIIIKWALIVIASSPVILTLLVFFLKFLKTKAQDYARRKGSVDA